MTAKTTKRAAEPRRANKPLMEKRRRARINQSLAALKTLILDAAKADNAKHSKLEKADILELTVRHFQRHRSLEGNVHRVRQYRAGFADCVREVQRYLDTPDAHTMALIDPGVKQRLLRHLENCVSEVDVDLRPPIPTVTDDRLQPPDSSTTEEVNNNLTLSHHSNNQTSPEPLQEPIHSPPEALQGPSTNPSTKVIKTYDGNFVFLLPSHYVQLASALGISLRAQMDNGGQKEMENDGEIVGGERNDEEVTGEEDVAVELKAEEIRENMWRPWWRDVFKRRTYVCDISEE